MLLGDLLVVDLIKYFMDKLNGFCSTSAIQIRAADKMKNSPEGKTV